MKIEDLVAALRRLKVQTGSLACLGCGLEHDCGVHGCRILREAAAELEALVSCLQEQAECEYCKHEGNFSACPDGSGFIPCEECGKNCVCKGCKAGSRWEWKGADLDD